MARDSQLAIEVGAIFESFGPSLGGVGGCDPCSWRRIPKGTGFAGPTSFWVDPPNRQNGEMDLSVVRRNLTAARLILCAPSGPGGAYPPFPLNWCTTVQK